MVTKYHKGRHSLFLYNSEIFYAFTQDILRSQFDVPFGGFVIFLVWFLDLTLNLFQIGGRLLRRYSKLTSDRLKYSTGKHRIRLCWQICPKIRIKFAIYLVILFCFSLWFLVEFEPTIYAAPLAITTIKINIIPIKYVLTFFSWGHSEAPYYWLIFTNNIEIYV